MFFSQPTETTTTMTKKVRHSLFSSLHEKQFEHIQQKPKKKTAKTKRNERRRRRRRKNAKGTRRTMKRISCFVQPTVPAFVLPSFSFVFRFNFIWSVCRSISVYLCCVALSMCVCVSARHTNMYKEDAPFIFVIRYLRKQMCGVVCPV